MNDHTPPVIDDDEDVIPGTIFNARQARILKIVVIVMGVMLIVGFAALVAIIAYRATHPVSPPPIAPAGVGVPRAGLGTVPQPAPPISPATGATTPQAVEALLPKGATPISTSLDGARLAVLFATPAHNYQVVVIDLDRWRVAGTVTLRQP